MKELVVTLPRPPATTNPNVRAHWAAKARANKLVRNDAYLATLAAIREQNVEVPFGSATVQARWWFREKRLRDDDNLTASLKAVRDGVADALQVNDNLLTWLPPEVRIHPAGKPMVELVIRETL